MSYEYQTQRAEIFTEKGMDLLLKIRDRVRERIDLAGAVRMQEAISGIGASNSWTLLACVDYLVEKGEIREVTQTRVAGQHRVFVAVEG